MESKMIGPLWWDSICIQCHGLPDAYMLGREVGSRLWNRYCEMDHLLHRGYGRGLYMSVFAHIALCYFARCRILMTRRNLWTVLTIMKSSRTARIEGLYSWLKEKGRMAWERRSWHYICFWIKNVGICFHSRSSTVLEQHVGEVKTKVHMFS